MGVLAAVVPAALPALPAVVPAAVAAGTAAAGWQLLRRRPPGGAGVWERRNHAGAVVTLLEGPAWVTGALAGVLAAPGAGARTRLAGALAVTGAGAAGLLDDLRGSSAERGLRGHLGALARGRVTTGALKVGGIGATGVLASAVLLGGAPPRGGAPVRALDAVVAGGVVAGAANLANLLDLRPGRALKAVLLAAVPAALTGGGLTAAACGASAALLPADLGRRAMLGDAGANAAGALLGTALVAATTSSAGRGPAVRAAALGVLTALAVASERVSFSAVVDAVPVLRALDALGTGPAGPTAGGRGAPAPG